MDFRLDAEERNWRTKVVMFLRGNVTQALRDEIAEHGLEYPDGEVAAFRRKVGEKGWFGLNWPREYGGLDLGHAQMALVRTDPTAARHRGISVVMVPIADPAFRRKLAVVRRRGVRVFGFSTPAARAQQGGPDLNSTPTTTRGTTQPRRRRRQARQP